MNPLLEYYQRNNVTSPYILYGNSHLLLQNPTKIRINDKYRFFEVKSVNKEGENGINIGRFEMSLLVPRRCNESTCHKRFTKEIEWIVYWQDYRDHIIGKVAEWNYSDWTLLSEKKQLEIAFWEILSYTHDYNFSQLPIYLLNLNCKILDSNIPLEIRISYIHQFIYCINEHIDMSYNSCYDHIVKAWHGFCEIYKSSKYAHWLIKLSKGEPCWN